MSKLGNWRAPNWYHDQGLPTKAVLELRRKCWKAMRKGRNIHAARARQAKAERRNRFEIFILSPEAAQLERKGLNSAYRGAPASRLNYPYRGRGQDFAA